MGALDLNKVAVCMGKVIKLLSDIQPYIIDGKDDLCSLAYMCRVGILDRIQANGYMSNQNLQIKIPTGVFSYRKETMASALRLTVGQLKQIADMDIVTSNYIEEILNKTGVFYTYDKILSEQLKGKI